MKDRDLAIIKDISECIEETGLVTRTVIGTSLEIDGPLPVLLPAAAVLWRETAESNLGADGVSLATVKIEVVIRIAIENGTDAGGKLEDLLELKNELLEAILADTSRSGLADGIHGTVAHGSVSMEKARNNFSECRMDLACDYILSDQQTR